MIHYLKGKQSIWAIGLSIIVMGFLYAWFVYAGEIETDINKVASQITTITNGKFSLDPAAIALETHVANAVEAQQNNGIAAGMYSVGPLASDPNASRAANILTNHFSNFCGSPETGGSCPSDPLLQFGDTKVSSILSGTTYNAARQAAVAQYLYNLIPIPNNNLAPFLNNGSTNVAQFPTSLPQSNPNSQKYPNPQQSFASTLSNEAMISIPLHTFAVAAAKRTAPSSGGDSMMEIMERVALQRFMSSSWADSLNPPPPPQNNSNMSTEANLTMQVNAQLAHVNQLLQEMTLMQSYQVWLEYERYRQSERIEALLAAMVIQNSTGAQAAAAIATNNQGSAAIAPPSGGS